MLSNYTYNYTQTHRSDDWIHVCVNVLMYIMLSTGDSRVITHVKFVNRHEVIMYNIVTTPVV